jgi:phytoene dehydrogenase-like protein
VTKLNFVIEGDVPWSDQNLCKVPTVHLGGSFLEMARSKAQIRAGHEPEQPYLIISQPGSVDRTRWQGNVQPVSAYLQHTTSSTLGSQPELRSMQILEQLEKCAPGFASRIRSIVSQPPEDLESENDNLRQGDIFGGANDLFKMLRGPLGVAGHYRIGKSHHYLASSSTWPGTGVHGMSGRNATLAALKVSQNES